MFDNITEFKENFRWINLIDEGNFEKAALTIFRYQASFNPIYRAYIEAIGQSITDIRSVGEIPFLPISFFKTHRVVCEGLTPEDYFESSGTTSTVNSRHYLPDLLLYEACFRSHFQRFYGSPEGYVFLCLLPSYLEREHSSLVYMANGLIRESRQLESAFYLNEFEQLGKVLKQLVAENKKIILLGVTFALLDFAAFKSMDLSSVIVMETGGMKGRRQEWTRQQVHDFLKSKWQLPAVHSEYGMSELLSQAYSKENGIYHCPNIMKVSVRDENDPLSNKATGKGCLNIIDLGNLYSCSFIATEDLGTVDENGQFEVNGRMDYSALRGCSLMVV